MTDTSFDGTWTLLIGEEEANADENSEIVIEGDRARYTDRPEKVGAFVVGDDRVTFTFEAPGSAGRGYTETIVARPLGLNSLSGTLNVVSEGDDDDGFSEPCVLTRGIDLWARTPPKVESAAAGRAAK